MRNYDLAPLMRQWIGFDKLANAMQTSLEPQGFPPYNIEKVMITTTASLWRWPDFARVSWILRSKAHA